MSVLAVPNIEQYCRKELIHVAYGLSKDFCLNGYRLGCLLSPWNEEMIDAVRSIAVFTWISSTTEAMALRLLSEPKTVDHFMRTNQKRLAQSYMVAATVLREHGIPFIPAQGGHFLWMDLRQFFPEHLAQAAKAGERGPEYVLWHAMLEEGVLLNPGEMFTESQVTNEDHGQWPRR
ncbi:hypothetical protein BGW38_004911 [Lunasporangiospora selenospora]|uniref:Aminotransferase class I/classII large domain-containing protein n=1 Tax=Lunasporangiospora selenospora TaxID=979761 RepID=A0A9P6FNQ1_9FUNG|nr:hypothetical protein BGW38_004911 [Lunasporangiospora selenospora]